MAVGDIYRTNTFMTLFGVTAVNVWHYRLTSDTGTATELPAVTLDAIFNTVLMPQVLSTLSDEARYEDVETVCYRDPLDAKTGSVSLSGALFTNACPTSVAISIRSQRPGPGTRRGYKRFIGLSVTSLDNNGLTPTYIALWTPVLLNLSLNRTLNGRTFEPVIATGPRILGTAVTGYRSGDWSLAPRPVSSQVSRKA